MARFRGERWLNERVCIRTVRARRVPTVYAVVVDDQWRDSFLTAGRARECAKRIIASECS